MFRHRQTLKPVTALVATTAVAAVAAPYPVQQRQQWHGSRLIWAQFPGGRSYVLGLERRFGVAIS